MSIKTNSKGSWGVSPGEGASAAVVDPHRQLAAGVLLQATKDAQGGNLEACLWLGSYTCDLFCEVTGFTNDQSLRLMTDILLDDDLRLEFDTGYLENIDQVGV